MTVNSITPNLMVEDVEETVEWYERVFDAAVVATLPADDETGYFWAQVMIEDSALMFQERGSLEEKLPVLEGVTLDSPMALYVDIDDANRFYERLDRAGVEVVKAPQETDFGWRQFAVEDRNGYVLWFGEKLEDDQAQEIGRHQRTYHGHLTEGEEGHRSRRSAPGSESDHWG
jgi:uncharacterized glyoxalase superfamily protein PhnB